MSTYHTIITNAGKQLFANAINSSNKVNISHLSLGDGNGNMPTPNATRTRLVNERTKVAVNDVKINASNANWLEVSAIIPSNNGGYTVREIGLYAGNTLVAIGNFPATYKPSANEGGAREMSIKVVIALENASVVNVSLDNSLVYATQKWVEQNFVNHNEVVNNLTSTDTTKPLSANMGKQLKGEIDTLNSQKLGKTDNAVSSSKLATPRTITLTGDVSGQTGFDGSANVGIGVTLANTGVQAGTYQSLTVDAKGRVTNGQTVLNSLITATTATGTTNQATGNTNTYLNLVTRTGTSTHSQGSSTKITGTNGISVSSDTAGALTITGTRASDTAVGVTQLSHATNGTDKTKAASEYALGEVRRMANQAQVTADGIALTWNNIQNKPATFTPSTHSHAWGEITGKPNNIAFTDGNIATATKLQTARTINNVPFDGTQNITITDSTKAPTVHRHNWSEIDRVPVASTSAQGITQLNNSLTSTATNQALTANQGRVLNDKIDNKSNLKTIDWLTDKSSNYQLTGFYRGNSQPLDGINTSSLEMHITHPAVGGNAHARGIGFDYGSTGFGIYTHAWDAEGRHLGRKIILTEDNGVMKSGDTMTGVLTLNNQRWPRLQLASNQGDQALLLESGGTDGTHCLIVRPHTDGVVSGSNIARFNLPTTTGTKTLATEEGNVASATRLQTARNIAMTGDGTWNVNFDGSGNVTGALTLANSGVQAGSYNSVTVDAKGRVTAGLTQTHGLVTATTATGTANTATTNSNTFLNIVASGVGTANSVGSSTQITGTNGISVSSDTAGKLIISRDNNSPTATKLQTARTISLTGAVTGSASFDGSGNVNLATTIQSVGERVAVMTGTVAHGGTIPLPSGFSENQCKWFVSPADFKTTPHIANNQGDDILAIRCSTAGRVVTAQVAMVNTSRGRLDNAWKNISANYIIIGVK